jgi:hypothetical protein
MSGTRLGSDDARRVTVFREECPAHAEITRRGARCLDKTHLEHDLLGGRDLQRVDDAGGRETGRYAHRPLDRLGIPSIAAQHELAIDIIDPNASTAGPLVDLRSKAAGIQLDLDIHHADQISLCVVEQDIGRPDLLAQNDELPVADLVRIGDVRIGNLDDREGNVEPKVPGFVLNKRHTGEQVDFASREAGVVCLRRRPPQKLRDGEIRQDEG